MIGETRDDFWGRQPPHTHYEVRTCIGTGLRGSEIDGSEMFRTHTHIYNYTLDGKTYYTMRGVTQLSVGIMLWACLFQVTNVSEHNCQVQ